jgi:hypothetical protein
MSSQGINKIVAWKKEANWGVKPTATGAQSARRVTASFQLEKDVYQSNEINLSQQIKDFRHGTRRATGTLSGELSGNAYTDLIAAAVRRDFTAGVALTASSIVAVDAVNSKFVRSSGSWLSDGFKVGVVVETTGFAASGNNGLFVITDVTATDLVVASFDATSPLITVAEGVAVSLTVLGDVTYIPTVATERTDDSFSIEEFYPDTTISRTFLGMQVDSMSMNIAPNSMVTIDFGFLGKDAEAPTNSQYFTNPTAQPNEQIYSGPDGVLIINGVANRLTTSLTLNLANGIVQEAVIGSTSIGAKARGKSNVTGSLTSIFDNDDYLDIFDGETEVDVTYALRTSDKSEAFAIHFPRVKLGSGTTDDGEKVIILSSDYQALERIDGSTKHYATTLVIQDTTL